MATYGIREEDEDDGNDGERTKTMGINTFRKNRFGPHQIYRTLPWKQLTSAGSKVHGGVGWVGRWVGGLEDRMVGRPVEWRW